MPVLIRIAFRNMWEHKAKSLIIGSLVAIGVLVIVLGNAMMDSAEEGMRQSFIEGFTGDIMITPKSDTAISIFGIESASTMDEEAMIVPRLPHYHEVLEHIKADSRVAGVTSMATTFALITKEGSEDAFEEIQEDPEAAIFAVLFGVDVQSYFQTFPGLEIELGKMLTPGQTGIMLTTSMFEILEKKYKDDDILPGYGLRLTGMSGMGMRIRELPLVGSYFRGEADKGAPYAIVDADTVRALAGLTMAADAHYEIGEEEAALLSVDNFDSFFDDELFDTAFFTDTLSASQDPPASVQGNVQVSDFIGDTSGQAGLNKGDSDAWHFLLVRLHNSAQAGQLIGEWQAWADSQGYDIRVNDWKEAGGTIAKMADILRIIFNIAIVIIAIVAVIIMMNTLVISVIERTAEIGTMRALGATKSFVRQMFLTETLTLTVFFGIIGSVLVTVLILVLNALNIPLENTFAKLLLGGETIHLVPSLGSYIGTLIAIFGVAWFAHLYPVSVALRIQPVKAMQAE